MFLQIHIACSRSSQIRLSLGDLAPTQPFSAPRPQHLGCLTLATSGVVTWIWKAQAARLDGLRARPARSHQHWI